MPSEIVATVTARKPGRRGIRTAVFQLTMYGVMVLHYDNGGGGVISLRDGNGALRDFSGSAPDDCLAALLAAVAAEGWEVA